MSIILITISVSNKGKITHLKTGTLRLLIPKTTWVYNSVNNEILESAI